MVGATNLSGQPLHYIYGAAATNLPGAGRVTYNPVGGTLPTMSVGGQTGTLVSGGVVLVDFSQAFAQLTGLQVGLYQRRVFDERSGGTASGRPLFD